MADPALEVALLDKHAYLFHGCGLSASFFIGYGQQPVEPNTRLHRVVQTLAWATSSDWHQYETDPDLPAEMKKRTRRWLSVLVNYLHDLPQHINRLRALTDSAR